MKIAIVTFRKIEEEKFSSMMRELGYDFQTADPGSIRLPSPELFLKEGNTFHKVTANDILYVNSDHVYVAVHTVQRKFLVRSSLDAFLKNLSAGLLCRVHRSYAINPARVEQVDPEHVLVSGQHIPVSKTYRQSLLAALGLGDRSTTDDTP